MKNIIGNIVIALGIILGIFIGGYLMLYGGIVQIVNNINPTNAGQIAIGVIKVLLCEIGFYIPWSTGVVFGYAIKMD